MQFAITLSEATFGHVIIGAKARKAALKGGAVAAGAAGLTSHAIHHGAQVAADMAVHAHANHQIKGMIKKNRRNS